MKKVTIIQLTDSIKTFIETIKYQHNFLYRYNLYSVLRIKTKFILMDSLINNIYGNRATSELRSYLVENGFIETEHSTLYNTPSECAKALGAKLNEVHGRPVQYMFYTKINKHPFCLTYHLDLNTEANICF